jgi:hypothetical protein
MNRICVLSQDCSPCPFHTLHRPCPSSVIALIDSQPNALSPDRRYNETHLGPSDHFASATLHILPEHTPPFRRAVVLATRCAQTALSFAMRAHTSTLALTRRGINHGPRTRSPHAGSLVVVCERVPGLSSSMHLLVISVVKLSLNRPASSPLFWNSANADFAVTTSTVWSRIGILQTQFLFFIVAAVVGFVAYARIPGLIRIQCAETAPVSSPVGAEGG